MYEGVILQDLLSWVARDCFALTGILDIFKVISKILLDYSSCR